MFGGIARQEAVVAADAGPAAPQDEPGLLPEDGIHRGGDAHDVPVALQVLRDAVGVAEGQGWRLDSDPEDGAEDEAPDTDRVLDAEDLRRQRRPRTPISRPLPQSDVPRRPQFTGARLSHRAFRVQQFVFLRYDTNLRILAAHCNCDHGVCRMNRTVKPGTGALVGRRAEQGRPLGYLLAWLLAPHKYPVEFPDRGSHSTLAVPGGVCSGHAAVSYEERCRLRAWAKTLPELQPIFDENLEDGGGSAEQPLQLV